MEISRELNEIPNKQKELGNHSLDVKILVIVLFYKCLVNQEDRYCLWS